MKIVRTKDVPWGEGMQRGFYFQRRKKLAGDAMSCSLWELPPGKKSYPFHKHNVTEEALFVISGSAKVRSSCFLRAMTRTSSSMMAPRCSCTSRCPSRKASTSRSIPIRAKSTRWSAPRRI